MSIEKEDITFFDEEVSSFVVISNLNISQYPNIQPLDSFHEDNTQSLGDLHEYTLREHSPNNPVQETTSVDNRHFNNSQHLDTQPPSNFHENNTQSLGDFHEDTLREQSRNNPVQETTSVDNGHYDNKLHLNTHPSGNFQQGNTQSVSDFHEDTLRKHSLNNPVQAQPKGDFHQNSLNKNPRNCSVQESSLLYNSNNLNTQVLGGFDKKQNSRNNIAQVHTSSRKVTSKPEDVKAIAQNTQKLPTKFLQVPSNSMGKTSSKEKKSNGDRSHQIRKKEEKNESEQKKCPKPIDNIDLVLGFINIFTKEFNEFNATPQDDRYQKLHATLQDISLKLTDITNTEEIESITQIIETLTRFTENAEYLLESKASAVKDTQQQQRLLTALDPHQRELPAPMEQLHLILKDVIKLNMQIDAFRGKHGDEQYRYLDVMLIRNLIKLDNIDVDEQDIVRDIRRGIIMYTNETHVKLERKAPPAQVSPASTQIRDPQQQQTKWSREMKERDRKRSLIQKIAYKIGILKENVEHFEGTSDEQGYNELHKTLYNKLTALQNDILIQQQTKMTFVNQIQDLVVQLKLKAESNRTKRINIEKIESGVPDEDNNATKKALEDTTQQSITYYSEVGATMHNNADNQIENKDVNGNVNDVRYLQSQHGSQIQTTAKKNAAELNQEVIVDGATNTSTVRQNVPLNQNSRGVGIEESHKSENSHQVMNVDVAEFNNKMDDTQSTTEIQDPSMEKRNATVDDATSSLTARPAVPVQVMYVDVAKFNSKMDNIKSTTDIPDLSMEKHTVDDASNSSSARLVIPLHQTSKVIGIEESQKNENICQAMDVDVTEFNSKMDDTQSVTEIQDPLIEIASELSKLMDKISKCPERSKSNDITVEAMDVDVEECGTKMDDNQPLSEIQGLILEINHASSKIKMSHAKVLDIRREYENELNGVLTKVDQINNEQTSRTRAWKIKINEDLNNAKSSLKFFENKLEKQLDELENEVSITKSQMNSNQGKYLENLQEYKKKLIDNMAKLDEINSEKITDITVRKIKLEKLMNDISRDIKSFGKYVEPERVDNITRGISKLNDAVLNNKANILEIRKEIRDTVMPNLKNLDKIIDQEINRMRFNKSNIENTLIDTNSHLQDFKTICEKNLEIIVPTTKLNISTILDEINIDKELIKKSFEYDVDFTNVLTKLDKLNDQRTRNIRTEIISLLKDLEKTSLEYIELELKRIVERINKNKDNMPANWQELKNTLSSISEKLDIIDDHGMDTIQEKKRKLKTISNQIREHLKTEEEHLKTVVGGQLIQIELEVTKVENEINNGQDKILERRQEFENTLQRSLVKLNEINDNGIDMIQKKKANVNAHIKHIINGLKIMEEANARLIQIEQEVSKIENDINNGKDDILGKRWELTDTLFRNLSKLDEINDYDMDTIQRKKIKVKKNIYQTVTDLKTTTDNMEKDVKEQLIKIELAVSCIVNEINNNKGLIPERWQEFKGTLIDNLLQLNKINDHGIDTIRQKNNEIKTIINQVISDLEENMEKVVKDQIATIELEVIHIDNDINSGKYTIPEMMQEFRDKLSRNLSQLDEINDYGMDTIQQKKNKLTTEIKQIVVRIKTVEENLKKAVEQQFAELELEVTNNVRNEINENKNIVQARKDISQTEISDFETTEDNLKTALLEELTKIEREVVSITDGINKGKSNFPDWREKYYQAVTSSTSKLDKIEDQGIDDIRAKKLTIKGFIDEIISLLNNVEKNLEKTADEQLSEIERELNNIIKEINNTNGNFSKSWLDYKYKINRNIKQLDQIADQGITNVRNKKIALKSQITQTIYQLESNLERDILRDFGNVECEVSKVKGELKNLPKKNAEKLREYKNTMMLNRDKLNEIEDQGLINVQTKKNFLRKTINEIISQLLVSEEALRKNVEKQLAEMEREISKIKGEMKQFPKTNPENRHEYFDTILRYTPLLVDLSYRGTDDIRARIVNLKNSMKDITDRIETFEKKSMEKADTQMIEIELKITKINNEIKQFPEKHSNMLYAYMNTVNFSMTKLKEIDDQGITAICVRKNKLKGVINHINTVLEPFVTKKKEEIETRLMGFEHKINCIEDKMKLVSKKNKDNPYTYRNELTAIHVELDELSDQYFENIPSRITNLKERIRLIISFIDGFDFSKNSTNCKFM